MFFCDNMSEELFADDESKFIYRQRDKYYKSGELSDIRCMCDGLLKKRNGVGFIERVNPFLNDGKKIVLFGCGAVGEEVFRILSDAGIKTDFFCDNNKDRIGKTCCGISVIGAGQLESLREDVLVIVSVSIPLYICQIKKQLLDMGFSEERIISACEQFGKQYFGFERFSFPKGSVFVDCGCYNGDDCISFINCCPEYGRIYAFEPDGVNYANCREAMKSYERVTLVPSGVWKESGTLNFNQGKSGSSFISESGGDEIAVTSIDDCLQGEKASLIKMDIEGSELAALEGASETIKRWKPQLAVCVYHKPDDIYDIPSFIKDLNAGYRLYLRHYSVGRLETVLYAI